ncbi:YitT family protein [Vagococcus fluvialis]|uniref:YitT family protein n=1 Tax=Vagococcus fluvialis TaxID=2738 RepID=UPI001D0BA9AC|nr:YitT family protein [Vagococcus fluvialis]MDT2746455.1 YitT family protein [Vagococcus fluvialis]UDM70915.1 YitT family protein [Vagococcus fluvialis]UDM75771.1 YitT family protein [Vagococcus fluvialis]UDM78690.1 YitT family protein [Vagococcus fluvialis]UDM82602.1 YitT family protein [Vagococcus fluvialis]
MEKLEDLRDILINKQHMEKVSMAVINGILQAIALNMFWRPGHIYASGVTGLGQIVVTLTENITGVELPMSVVLYMLNVPLFILAWYKISKKFTIFTMISVFMTSLFIQIIPVTALSTDPIICAIFGGAVCGLGVGLALKSGLSSGGLDIVSVTIRKMTGKNVGSLNIIINACIILTSGFLFGWPYAFYSAFSIFVNGKVVDVVFTKQKKMEIMIITTKPDAVIEQVQRRIRRGITILNNAEGAFSHEKQTVLITIITRDQIPLLQIAMRDSDPKAFVSISDNVKIMGNFYDPLD